MYQNYETTTGINDVAMSNSPIKDVAAAGSSKVTRPTSKTAWRSSSFKKSDESDVGGSSSKKRGDKNKNSEKPKSESARDPEVSDAKNNGEGTHNGSPGKKESHSLRTSIRRTISKHTSFGGSGAAGGAGKPEELQTPTGESLNLPVLTQVLTSEDTAQHLEKFNRITDQRVDDYLKERRELMEATCVAPVYCCGSVKTCVHGNECLNKIESRGGRVIFDKIGDLLKAKEVNIELKRCEFGHKMRDAHFPHLDGLNFNSASYGCTPKFIIEARQVLELEMQANNVLWRFKTVPLRVRQSEYALANALHIDPDDVVLVPNANYATNAVLKSQPWQPDDAIMIFSCDYDATIHACEWLRWRFKIQILLVDMPLPASHRAIVRRVQRALERAKREGRLPKLANFCHITSKTAFVFPAKKLIDLFHKFGVSVMVDGAQAAGQISLNLAELQADYYIGTMHKWMYTCPGVGFLVVQPEKQDLIEPLVVSYFYGQSFTKTFSYTGHMDFTGYITAHYSLDFVRSVCGGFRKIRRHLSKLARRVVTMLTQKWGTRCCQRSYKNYANMPIVQLPMFKESPSKLQAAALMLALLDQYKITTFIFVEEFYGQKMLVIRLAIQIFHEFSDFEKLGDIILSLDPTKYLETRLEDVKDFLGQT